LPSGPSALIVKITFIDCQRTVSVFIS
jgi:hypothetical protein